MGYRRVARFGGAGILARRWQLTSLSVGRARSQGPSNAERFHESWNRITRRETVKQESEDGLGVAPHQGREHPFCGVHCVGGVVCAGGMGDVNSGEVPLGTDAVNFFVLPWWIGRARCSARRLVQPGDYLRQFCDCLHPAAEMTSFGECVARARCYHGYTHHEHVLR